MIVRTTFAKFLALGFVGVMGGALCPVAQSQTAAPSNATVAATGQERQAAAASPTEATPSKPVAPVAPKKDRKDKAVYTGPTGIVVLPPTPMLDGEGKQLVDPDGKLIFNPATRQIRDKKGHPVFDAKNAPVFQTATNLGYDERGKKIAAKKVKSHKTIAISISAGTLTVDGWTGKARLNYDIADFKYLYIYAPGIGTTIVSSSSFPGAKEQPGGFNDQVLKIMVDGHPIELSSEKRLLGKKPVAAWVMVDRGFLLPAKFPVLGYGTTTQAPYVWPGAKDTIALRGPVQAPPLPADVRPALLLAPCPAGMIRSSAPTARQQPVAADQPCVFTSQDVSATPAPAPAATSSTTASPSSTTEP